uniref:Secreted protein n=1 Tax=Poecilia formosa TaxID=48698 RepID=A0A087YJX0_POEFO
LLFFFFFLLTLPRLFLHQQKQHVLHVVLHGAGLVGRDRTQVEVTGEKAKRSGGAATRLVFLQNLHHLHR